LLLSVYAQWRVSATFAKFSQIPSRLGITGADAAQRILAGAGLHDVTIEPIAGQLSDHYDPGARTLRLSEAVYGDTSIAAISVAAHEAGHALQHADAYPLLGLRTLTVPMANLGSTLMWPILLVGMFIHLMPLALNIAIVLYLGVVAFTLVTLPVEFNASHRALGILQHSGLLAEEEMPGARSVLSAAALTYVAATVSAILTLLRLLLLRGRN